MANVNSIGLNYILFIESKSPAQCTLHGIQGKGGSVFSDSINAPISRLKDIFPWTHVRDNMGFMISFTNVERIVPITLYPTCRKIL